MSANEMGDCVRRTLNRYFRDLDGEAPACRVRHGAEKRGAPMLEVVMNQANGNQTVAAAMLGINRNTLRRMLVDHDLL
jgi:Fis family transcriptional regulator